MDMLINLAEDIYPISDLHSLREQAALMADIYDIARAEQGPFIPHEEVKSRYCWLFEESTDAETTS